MDDIDPQSLDLDLLAPKLATTELEDVPLPREPAVVREYVLKLHALGMAGNALYAAVYDSEPFPNVGKSVQMALNDVERAWNTLERFRRKHRVPAPELGSRSSQPKKKRSR